MYAVANKEGKPEDRGESAYIAVSDFIEGIAILARDDVNYVKRLTFSPNYTVSPKTERLSPWKSSALRALRINGRKIFRADTRGDFRSVITEPKLLILDEPTLGLDVIARRELWKLIKARKGKTTIILTTHYLEEVEALCDRICLLKEGEKIFEGTVEEMKTLAGQDNFEDAFVKISQGEICRE